MEVSLGTTGRVSNAVYYAIGTTPAICCCWSPGFDNVREMYEDENYKLREIV